MISDRLFPCFAIFIKSNSLPLMHEPWIKYNCLWLCHLFILTNNITLQKVKPIQKTYITERTWQNKPTGKVGKNQTVRQSPFYDSSLMWKCSINRQSENSRSSPGQPEFSFRIYLKEQQDIQLSEAFFRRNRDFESRPWSNRLRPMTLRQFYIQGMNHFTNYTKEMFVLCSFSV